eukprot:TRINITY_DN9053_c0_g1_i2.p1 TRINITY_DN9053_c0_g1~~TRINITY_DN9053_c0_g1_i2.p1  ORF type:complete len:434 (-),score=145.45 TRINITY_DN9053_c0_g1_i2:279-1580(-)
MISHILIVNSKGDILLLRSYRGEELSRGVANAFRIGVIAAKEVRSPVQRIENYSFLHVRSENIHIVAVTKLNCDTAMAFEVLHRTVELFRGYFGGKVDEDSLRAHYILALELLDEMLDYGYAQNCSFESLQPFITQKGAIKAPKMKEEQLNKITIQATGTTPWRNPDIRHKKNELFIDIVESVNVLVAVDGKQLRADVSGAIQMRVYLSGMPDCKLGLNDKILMDKETRTGGKTRGRGIALDDCTFHQCVRLGKFDSDRTISFIPPDGEFELMKYRTTENINIPFKILPHVREISKTRIQADVTIKANFSRELNGTAVKVSIPMPKNTAVARINVEHGKAKYVPEASAIVWKIRRFPGQAEYHLSAEVELSASVSSQVKKWSRPPISMEFQVPMFTASGLQVRFLKVLEQKQQYQAIKWVRYVTQAGNYQYRI